MNTITTTELTPTLYNISKETMTSLEIADITGKNHAHIMRDIRTLLDQGVNESNFGLVNYKDRKGETRPCYELTKKGCLILASGYDALLREKIINRWEDLEKEKRNGGFIVPQSFSEALMLAAKQQQLIEEQQKCIEEKQKSIEEKNRQIEADKPKVVFADALIGAETNCLIGELAKTLTQNGYKIGQNRLFLWLRQNHYLGTKGEYYNMPYQKYIEQGLFFLDKSPYTQGVTMKIGVTPKVTPKGQQYFINKFLSNQPTIDFE